VTPELEQIRREVEQATSGCSEPNWRQAPVGKWSTAQVFEHLLLTYTGTTKGLRRVLEAGRPLGSVPTWPHRARKLVVTKFGWMPAGRTAFKQVYPEDGLDVASMGRFYDALVAMDATLQDAERRFGKNALLLDHPFLGPLNAQEWRLFHRTHTRHHLKQAIERMRGSSASVGRRASA
jgi:Protein of unknown function (DUF1569)